MHFVCESCAQNETNWNENCPHAMELWHDGYNCAVRERSHPRLASEDVRKVIGKYSFSLENFYHLVADALNRILDEKEKTTEG